MKTLLIAAAILTSFSTTAYETNNATSYSGGRGGVTSGSTAFSGTSAVRLREQVEINQGAVASFLQSEDSMSTAVEVKEIAEIAKKALHEEIDQLSDRDAILNALSK